MSEQSTNVRSILEAAKTAGQSSLSAADAREICLAYGIPVPAEGLAGSSDEAAQISADIEFPVVMKIESADILHKSDAGGVVVGVSDADEARATYDEIIANAKAYDAGASIDGVLIQQQVDAGLEVIVGAVTDPSFGKTRRLRAWRRSRRGHARRHLPPCAGNGRRSGIDARSRPWE